ncbi:MULTISPECIES: dihydroxyacetone kinase subunit DhaK [unclassified Streptomyces]|uniref:dihydroxyacetone kinase subunit DhaK n=1 Tax=unclassified Streptomyces TaxID=2593676 RepID=UPI0037F7F3A5
MAYFALPDAPRIGARGLALSHSQIAVHEDPLFLRARDRHPDRRVGLVSGGGSGHEPLHVGLLGQGGLDAVAPGEMSASPHAGQITAASLAAATTGEVLHIVKNYAGDRVNFASAARQLQDEHVTVGTVVVDDDLATAGAASGPGRRGTAATLIVEKLLGAAADQGAGLTELVELGAQIVSQSRSLAVTARAYTSPTTLRPAFDLGREYDYGSGIHGERAARRINSLRPTQYIVRRMLADLLESVSPGPEGVILLVSGLGGTAELELRGISALAYDDLTDRGITVAAIAAGTYVSARDTAGISLTLTALRPGWLSLWTAPAQTPLQLPGAVSQQPPATTSSARPQASPTVLQPGRRDALEQLARLTREVHPVLTRLDQKAGDGDFGDNWAGGVERALQDARTHGTAGTAALATAFSSVGGTSGPLFGLLFTRLAQALGNEHQDQVDIAALATASADALDAIRETGGADVGDRTLLDALAPASDALASAADGRREAALTAAALAAIRGADTTATLPGRQGRASYVGDHALGIPDPGAVAIALIYTVIAQTYEPQHSRQIPDITTITAS